MRKSILFVAHGSRRAASNEEFIVMALRLRAALRDVYTDVEAAFLEFSGPGVETELIGMIERGMEDIVVYPFFLNTGKHVHVDIPEQVQKVQERYPQAKITVFAHLGSAPHIIDTITHHLESVT